MLFATGRGVSSPELLCRGGAGFDQALVLGAPALWMRAGSGPVPSVIVGTPFSGE